MKRLNKILTPPFLPNVRADWNIISTASGISIHPVVKTMRMHENINKTHRFIYSVN